MSSFSPDQSELQQQLDTLQQGGVATPRPASRAPQTQTEPELRRRVHEREVKRRSILDQAAERAKQGMGLIEHLRQETTLDQRRATIRHSILEQQRWRARVSGVVLAVFYLNFAAIAFFLLVGAGVKIVTMSDALMVLARVCGLTGTYLLLVQLLLVGRVPLLDRLYGTDRMARWHKRNGHIAFDLIVLHALFAVTGRTVLNDVSVVNTLDEVIRYRYMIHAVVALLLMAAAILTSIRIARKKVRHRAWHAVHLWTYVAVGLSFGHELFGPDFEGRLVAQSYLWSLYGITFATLVYCRIITPIRNTFVHQLRVSNIVEEGPGVTSVYMTGFRLGRLQARAGQFCWWRFLSGDGWREAHPFSLSMAPNGRYLRITVKSLGDYSSRIAHVPIGTWVTFEGPFGAFTHEQRTSVRSVLVAAGVGVTPIRSLLEGLPSADGDIAVIYRANSLDDAPLLQELHDLAAKRKAELHVVLGSRADWLQPYGPLTATHLEALVPDIHRRDVYICAAPPMTEAVRATLRSMGLSTKQVHYEAFD